jgi:hypothetical protein
MNVLTAEVQFGGSKITVFFTAPGRVDFRELVKDLASGLKSRVELKQVGARDETKLIGGTGICGREFCCSSFLREFVPVSIKMAKNQNLALNPNKVSGGCGRLLCCLTYEDETYSSLRKNIPPRGTRVFIPEIGGYGNVIKGDVLNQEVLLENERGQQETYSLDDVEVVAKNAGSSRDKSKEESIEWGDELDLAALEQFSEDSKSGGKKQSPRGGRNQRDGKGRNNRSNNRHDRSADKNSQKPRGDRGDKEENKNEKDSQSSKPDKARNKYNKRHGNKNKDPRNKDGSGRDQGGKSGNQNNKASDNSDGNQKGSNQNKKRRGNRYNKKKGSGSQDD